MGLHVTMTWAIESTGNLRVQGSPGTVWSEMWTLPSENPKRGPRRGISKYHPSCHRETCILPSFPWSESSHLVSACDVSGPGNIMVSQTGYGCKSQGEERPVWGHEGELHGD